MQSLDTTTGSLQALINLVGEEASEAKPLPDVPGVPVLETVPPPSAVTNIIPGKHLRVFETTSSNDVRESTRAVEGIANNPVPPIGPRTTKHSLKRLVSELSRKTALKSSTWSNTISSKSTTPSTSPRADVFNSFQASVTPPQPGHHTSIRHTQNRDADVPPETGRILGGTPFPTSHGDVSLSEHDKDMFSSSAELHFGPSGITLRGIAGGSHAHLDFQEDPEFNAFFFLSFRFFSGPLEVFDTLIAQYNSGPPEGLEETQLALWDKQARVVKIRIAKIFLVWLKIYWRYEWDADILEPLRQFASKRPADDPDSVTWTKVIERLGSTVIRVGQRSVRMRRRPERRMLSSQRPKPFKLLAEDACRRGKFDEVDILHFHSPAGHEEFARQLCLAASELFRHFDPEDAVRFWKDGKDRAVGEKLSRLSSFENALVYWVANTAIIKPTARSRGETMECFIEVAQVSEIILSFCLHRLIIGETAMRENEEFFFCLCHIPGRESFDGPLA